MKLIHMKIVFFLLNTFFVSVAIAYHGIRLDAKYYTTYLKDIEPNLSFERPTPWGYLVDTEGCRIPDFDLFHDSILKFLKKVEPVHCSPLPPLVKSNITTLWIDKSVFSHYNIVDPKELKCCYWNFSRLEAHPTRYGSNADDMTVYNSNCVPFEDSVEIHEEFINTVCSRYHTMKYADYHVFVPLKSKVEKRCEISASENRYKSGQYQRKVSVLILGLDAMSRRHLHRQMPKTLSFLTTELKGIEMVGYNNIAGSTFGNIVGAMVGMTEKELRETCHPNNGTKLDLCPWLWKSYSNEGYRTIYGEDRHEIGIFNYLKVGFVKQPTDYYLRPFMVDAEDEGAHEHNFCIGSRKAFEIIHDYMKKVALTFMSKPYFGLFWITSLAHYNHNFAQLADEVHLTLLRDLLQQDVLNNTILIFMSDHGARFGGIRQTYLGYIEYRLPILVFVFPDWFRNLYSDAIATMERNIHRLTTPFDLHETLKDLLLLDRIDSKNLVKRSTILLNSSKKLSHGVSLFSEVPEKRTCADAGVDIHWCSCETKSTLLFNDEKLLNASQLLVEHINNLLKPYNQCEALQLKDIKEVRSQVSLKSPESTSINSSLNYYLIIELFPGNGLFETTLTYNSTTESFEIPKVIIRINRYGDQGNCLNDYELRQYCYCRK